MAVKYERGSNPIWWIPDLVGLPLNDQYYISMLSNVFPYLPQLVYTDNQGAFPWSDPIQFLPNGTLPDNIYWPDNEVWRLEIRQGPLQSDPLIYVINNYDPSGNGGVTPSSESPGDQENQISNPQFAFVNFGFISGTSTPSFTTAASGTYHVAPGWDLVLTGAGTATVTQLILSAAQDTVASPHPPYALRLALNGWSTAVLQQRFNGLGGLFNNEFISMAVLARSETAANSLSFNVAPDSGAQTPVSGGSLSTGAAYELISGVAELPKPSTNSSLSNVAYVDIQIILNPNGTTDISNVQMLEQNSLVITPFPVIPMETLERQTDHLFHYYRDSIIIQPKNSMAVGWNFRQNPYQYYTGLATTVSTTPVYSADQTIVFTTAANGISVSRTAASASVPYGYYQVSARTAVAQGQIIVMQYIDPNSLVGFYGFNFSMLVRAKLLNANSTPVYLKARIFSINGLPNTLSATDPIASFAAGDPVFAGAYTGIQSENDPAYVLGSTYEATFSPKLPAYAFNKFAVAPGVAANATATFGIMIYTIGTLDNGGSPNALLLESISFVPNDFAIDDNPKSFDQVLRECQFYYEKSYNLDAMPGTVTLAGAQSVQLSSGTGNIAGIDRPFKVTKRTSPTVTWYSTAGATVARARNLTAAADMTVTANLNVGVGTTGYFTTSAPGADADEIIAQWTADARLAL